MATAVLDIDGTLVDTNYHHAIAWFRAFRQHGFVLPLWRIHRHIGMGGDQLVAALAGEGFDREHGDEVRAAEKVLYTELIGEVQPLEGARALIEDLKGSGHTVILASSAKPDELEHYLTLLDARSLVDGWTDSGDVEPTKPAARPRAGRAREGGRQAEGRRDDRRLDLGLPAAKAARGALDRRAHRRFQRARSCSTRAPRRCSQSVEDLRQHLDETVLRV